MRNWLLILFFLFPVLSFSQIAFIELDSKQIPEPVSRDLETDTWDKVQPGYEKLSVQAKQLLYWTNFCRNNPSTFWDSAVVPILKLFPELNKEDARSLKTDLLKTGKLPMFTLNEILLKTAQNHSSDIARKKSPLSHTSTDGTDFGERIKRAGIKHCANENISLSSQSILLSVILLYLDINVAGKGHRKTLLDPNLREIGVGSALYGEDQYFLVQDFACQQ